MSSIKVVMPVGEYTAPMCHIDEFFPGELTVTTDDERNDIMRVFKDGEWLYGTGYDQHGNPAAFISNQAKARTLAVLELLNRKVA